MSPRRDSIERATDLVAFEIQGEGLAPAFGEGQVIVAAYGQACCEGGRVIVELVDGSALFVRLVRQQRAGVRVAHLLTKAPTFLARDRVTRVSPIRAMFSAGHAPTEGIAAWRTLSTKGGPR